MSPTKSMILLSHRRQEISDCGGRSFAGTVGENRTVRPSEVVHNVFASNRPKKCALISMGGPQPKGTQTTLESFDPSSVNALWKNTPVQKIEAGCGRHLAPLGCAGLRFARALEWWSLSTSISWFGS